MALQSLEIGLNQLQLSSKAMNEELLLTTEKRIGKGKNGAMMMTKETLVIDEMEALMSGVQQKQTLVNNTAKRLLKNYWPYLKKKKEN